MRCRFILCVITYERANGGPGNARGTNRERFMKSHTLKWVKWVRRSLSSSFIFPYFLFHFFRCHWAPTLFEFKRPTTTFVIFVHVSRRDSCFCLCDCNCGTAAVTDSAAVKGKGKAERSEQWRDQSHFFKMNLGPWLAAFTLALSFIVPVYCWGKNETKTRHEEEKEGISTERMESTTLRYLHE